MHAKMKCSNCGAEMSNLRLTWGAKYLWIMVPLMLLACWPLLSMTFFKGDITKDLAISNIQKRSHEDYIEIIGLITNSGNRTWTNLTIEAEFFDASGAFIDEATEYLSTDIAGNAKEHFKITIRQPSAILNEPDTKMAIKVSILIQYEALPLQCCQVREFRRAQNCILLFEQRHACKSATLLRTS